MRTVAAVAIAAFAAASIAKTEPMRTGFAAVRVGIVMFTIPFVFAWYPELLLIDEAKTVLGENGQRILIEVYSAGIDWIAMGFLLLRLAQALYLLASALARFDRGPVNRLEMSLRLIAALLVLWKTAPIMWLGLGLSAAIVGLHSFVFYKKSDEPAPV